MNSFNKKHLFFGFFLLASLSCSDGKIQSTSPKNLLLIIVDDLRPEINSWGNKHIKTPHIDRLVEKSVSFTNAFCQYANCSPSRKSFLTGLSPERTGHMGNFKAYIRSEAHTTLPGFFKSNGYYTCSLGKVYHDAKDDRTSWDFYYDVGDPKKPEDVPWESYGSAINQVKESTDRPAIERENIALANYNDFKICEEALKQLDVQSDKPFFMALGFRKPHLPFAAPKKYWDLYDREDINISNFLNAPLDGDTIVYQWSELAAYEYFSTHYKSSNYRNKHITAEKAKELRHGYYACVSFIDDLIGMMMNKLKDLEIDDNTIVVLLGDHGYHLGDQQIWGKHSCYNLSTRVPLILYDPSKKVENRFRNQFVELLDLYPSLAEICALPTPQNIDGKSFARLIENSSLKNFEAAFNQYQTFQDNPAIKNLMAYAVHTSDYNYIEWQDLENERKIVQRELYKIKSTGIEQENIAIEKNIAPIIEDLSNKIEMNFKQYRIDHKNKK